MRRLSWIAMCGIMGAVFCGGIFGAQIPYTPGPMPDDSGFVSLFNGRDMTGWTMQWPGNWTVERGILTGRQDPATGSDSWLFTEQTWDDFVVQLEFKITKGGNSGVGIRMPKGVEGRPSQHGYEIQINDSDEEFPTGSAFRHVAASPKMHEVEKWNEMAIYGVKDHLVVYVNKIKVLDTKLQVSSEGRIGLQVHGGEQYKNQVVEFRNIRAKDLKPQYKAEPSPFKYNIRLLDDYRSEGITVTDINRDGKLDITCGPRWFEAPDWKAHTLREVVEGGEFVNNYGEIAMDVNRDGWTDIISGGWFIPKMAWYENPGNFSEDKLWKEHVIANHMDGTETFLPADVDSDGRTDLLINRYNTAVPVAYFAYVGLDKSESGFEERVIGDYGRGHGMGFGDVNGDGRNDVVVNRGWYKAPQKPAEQPWEWSGRKFHAEESCIPFLVEDLNLDGLNDIVWAHAHNFGIFWLEQTRDSAGREAWIEHVIDDTVAGIHDPVLIDMDGDGIKDIVAGRRYRGHAGADPGDLEPLYIFWYKVTKGPDPKFTKYTITYDENIGAGMNLSVLDIDFDGDLDIVAPGKSGLYLLENVTE